MNELILVKSEHFGQVETDIYSNGSDMFMTIFGQETGRKAH